MKVHFKRQKALDKYLNKVFKTNKWKDKIDLRAYEALMNWTIEITD